MIQGGAPNRVFEIAELARLIASQLVLTSRKSTANFARACRYLEEPALSALWATQPSLRTLLRVLPEETWDYIYQEPDVKEVRGLDLPLGKSDAEVSGYYLVVTYSL